MEVAECGAPAAVASSKEAAAIERSMLTIFSVVARFREDNKICQ